MAEKLDPEETYSMMEKIYEILIRKVNEYGGTVNELTGDGIMALFGAPIALEDAPQRAIRASLSIHRELVLFNEKMRLENLGLPPIKMRAGIHTGAVVVGTLSNDLRVGLRAMGDTVNLAPEWRDWPSPALPMLLTTHLNSQKGSFGSRLWGKSRSKARKSPSKSIK